MIGLALGDALGAHVEFRPRQFLVENPVKDLKPGGTWGLKEGQVFMKILCLKLTLCENSFENTDFDRNTVLIKYKKFDFTLSTHTQFIWVHSLTLIS